MTTTVIVASVLAILGILSCRSALTTVRTPPRRWMASGLRALLGMLLVAIALLLGTIVVALRGYHALTYEAVAATVKTEPLGPRHFRATIVLADKRLAMYDLLGDDFYIDARILKWPAWATVLGLHTAYELDRVAGRYNAAADERHRPHTAYSFARSDRLDLFTLARQTPLGLLVDAEYGSAAFVAGTHPSEYEVRVSATGLLMMPVTR